MKLDSQTLKSFLKLAADKLEGEWLLVGGTLLPAVGIDVRATVDIDLVGLGEKENAQVLKLMEICESLALSIETVNQAAAFFVKKAAYKKSELHVLIAGKKATIYRPSVDLFWRLKLARLSETDVIDCQHYLAYCRSQGDKIKFSQLQKLIQAKLDSKPSPQQLLRLKGLHELVSD